MENFSKILETKENQVNSLEILFENISVRKRSKNFQQLKLISRLF